MLRQDYIMRLISELGQFVRAAITSGDPGKETEALQAVIHAQQQLFQESPQIALARSLEEQIDHLARGETPSGAADRVIDYAKILEQAARIYDHINKESLGLNSRILGLSALLIAATRWPEQHTKIAPEIDHFCSSVTTEALPPPMQELLAHHLDSQVP